MAQAAAAIRNTPAFRISRLALARQALASCAAVMAAYWVYWLVAVPLIEPNLEERTAVRASDEAVEQARTDVTARQRELSAYFNPGDWETDKPAIGQSGEMRLLYKTLQPKPDGTVELRPCTLMFFPKGGSGSNRPIIMRTTGGADIRFDDKIDLRSADLRQRKFLDGRLIGPLRIYQKETVPGAGDDLEIITDHDIMLTGNRAFTPDRVQFRAGRNYGSGRELEILLGAPDGQTNQPNAMRGTTVQTVRLNHDVRMRLELGNAPPAAGQPAPAAEPPVEITCQGHFQFDLQEYAASFHNKVDVFRLNPVGESDQINGQLLTVFFARPGQTLVDEHTTPGHPANANMASRVLRIEIRGKPVTLRSPAQGIYASCDGIDFVPGGPGSPGSMAAYGPGVIRGNLPKDPRGKFDARWARELRFEPEPGGALHKATLRGATVVSIGALGTITSDEVFVWLSPKPVEPQGQVAQVALRREQPGPPNAGAWQLERVLAQRYPNSDGDSQGDVVIDAPQLHAVAASLEARIERPSQGPGQPAAAGPDNPQPGNPQRPAQNPNEKFDLTGRSVFIQLVPQGEELTIAGAAIEGTAQLEQLTTVTRTPQRTLLVKGERLSVTEAHTDATKVTIAGSPGYVEAGGMTLWGGAIQMERKKNWLWIDGPGRLSMPMTQDLDGKALARPQNVTVDWKRRMDFLSNTAVFEGQVVARSAQQVLNTGKLEAILTRAIDFSNPNVAGTAQRPDLAVVRSHGPTSLESRQFEETGKQASTTRMELADLSIDRTSGQIGGRGPGWVRHVMRGTPPAIAIPGAPQPKADPAAADNGFTYLFITFRQGIDGNINRRAVKFFDDTRTVYGPVADWNATIDDNDPAALGPQGMTLDADALEVREMNRRPQAKRGWFELEASGNIFAEGQRFSARGSSITYAEEKDLLVLRGDPAEMFVDDDMLGRMEHRAGEVSYWVKLRRVTVNSARGFDLGLPGRAQKKLMEDRKKQPPAPR